MIISDKHKYLFIELPRTGTSSISRELIENYNGRPILHKHATYKEFLKKADLEQRRYRTFSCIRNPIDRMVSFYVKCKTGFYDNRFQPNHKKNLYDRLFLIPRVRFIKETDAEFDEFLIRFHNLPYIDWSILDHDHFNHIIRFENLNEDFQNVIRSIGLNVVRNLPQTNVTLEKGEFTTYLNPQKARLYIKIFGPAMHIMGYKFPEFIENQSIPSRVWIKFHLIRTMKKIYWINRPYF